MDFEKVIEAGCFILSDDMFDGDYNEPIAMQLRSIRDTHMLKAKPQHQEWDSDEEDECKNI
jgi:hypothetical protein